jgi:phosphohistidine phosphatase
MKTLLILRHAKSDWDEPEVADHDRPLTARGKRDAPNVGRWLRAEDLVPDLIISSTAKRARKTARLAADASGYEGEIRLEAELYEAGAETYVEVLQTVPEPCPRVMVVGHNPGLEELVQALTGELQSMPTAGLAQITLPIATWKEMSDEVEGDLVQVWRSRE